MSNPAPAPVTPPKGRLAQMRQAYRLTKRTDRWIGPTLLAVFVVSAGIAGTIGYLLIGDHWLGIAGTIVLATLFGALVTVIVFGRKAEKAMYAAAEGQVGGGAGALQMLKRGWFVKPAIAFTKNQDVVHRVVGRPGVVLVGEGHPGRTQNLLIAERKKTARIVGEDVPVTTLVVGRGKDQVPLPKLVKSVRKLPKAVKPGDLTAVVNKLNALDAMRPVAPTPRGPVPTSVKGARKMMRG